MTDSDLIRETLHRVRRRWRLRLALEAGIRVLAAVVGLLVLWAIVWGVTGGSQGLATAGRIVAVVAVVGVASYYLRRWLSRRPADATVALYVEEKTPALEQSLVAAVHALDQTPAATGLTDRIVAAARRGLEAIGLGRDLERAELRRTGGWLGGLALGSIALFVFGPQGLKDATVALANPWRPVPVAPTFLVAIEPGNVEVPRGGAAEISATLNGFTSDVADLVFRADSTADWERLPMARDTAASRFTSRLFDLVQNTEYFVEAGGVRSPSFRLTVVDLPAVSQMSATVSFPKYTGLPTETITEAGDLAVLKGSTVALRVATTRAAKAAFLSIEGRPSVPMTAGPNGSWSGAFRVSADAFYRVDLETDDGRKITGLNYAIDALEDGAPSVRFSAPGRDTKVTAVEEITAQSEASDDFGVTKLVLHVSVNGAEAKPYLISDSTVTALKELSAAHTFFLEEWTLTPGDLISYYAEATDGAGQSAKSDMYFLEVRPFDKTYREGEQAGGPPGAGGGESAEGLSERQRQLVVGTFNVLRDSATQSGEFAENVTTLAIGQGRLRTDVGNLITRLQQRQMASVDSTFDLISRELDSARIQMQGAEENLGRRKAREAMPAEQRALQHLQRAEAAYREVMVQMGGQQGGGGGGGQQQRAEELADLFELETDKLRNQYESVQREAGEQAERTLDETLERLRRLASRQEQENERMERAADALRRRTSQNSGGGGGASQRQLAQEAEEEARRLERLAREKNDQSLGDAARRLREAAEQMRRAASGGAQQSAAQGAQALERLKNTTRQLERGRSEGRENAIKELADRANELKARQQEAAGQATSLPADPAQRGERIEALSTRKDALARDV